MSPKRNAMKERKNMKRMMTTAMALLLVLLCCVTVQAEVKEEILFEGIAWGTDLKTVCQAMLDAGWINGEGADRFGQEEELLEMMRTRGFGAGHETSYWHFDKEDGLYIVNRDDDESANIIEVHLMNDMVAKPWMGVEIHNIGLLFALDGDTEKLVAVNVSLMVNREDLRPEFEKSYGSPDEANEDYRSLLWLGGNGTAVMYDESNVYFGLLNAKEIIDASRANVGENPRRTRPAPAPAPEPTPLPEAEGEDILDYVHKGELTFLGIPWDTDEEAALNTMIAQQLLPETMRGRLWNHKSSYPSALSDQGDHWKQIFPSSYSWDSYFFWSSSVEMKKTIGGYPVDSVTLHFLKDGDKALLKCVQINLRNVDGDGTREALNGKISAVLGEGTEWYGSHSWNGDNHTAIVTDGLSDSVTVTFGISVPEE